MWKAVQMEMERRKNYASEHGIQKLEYVTTNNPFAGRVICGCCGQIFGRKVWNSTDERLRRTIWRCNGKYQAFINLFNMMVTNRDYFMGKWQERLENDNVLPRYKAKQFTGILAEVGVIDEFDGGLYFALVEKRMVYDGRIEVSLLDGTAVECEIK